MKRKLTLYFICLSLVLIYTGCTDSNSSQQVLNILWISTEDASPTAMGAYGDELANTPNIDELASRGITYTRAYVPAPICAPARSSIITGIQAATLGTQHLRSEIPLPGDIKTLPQYLQNAGYYTTNNRKTDYNFSFNEHEVWDESSGEAHWRHRPENTPFFSVFNFTITHEGNANKRSAETDSLLNQLSKRADPGQVSLPPYLPDTKEMRRIWARYYDLISIMDQKVGKLLKELKDDGLADDTIVMFWSDHGFGLPRYKRWPYKSGLHVPLIVHMPDKYQSLAHKEAGSQSERLINLIDLAPTVLNLADAEIPSSMQGVPFLGKNSTKEREYVVATRSRADDVYEVSRTVIDDQYLYVRNYMPHQPWIQDAIIFGEGKESYRELHRVREMRNLPRQAQKMFQPKPFEELYDLKSDPYETTNLADDESYANVIDTLRTQLDNWIQKTRDTGFLPESEMMIRSRGSTPYEMAQDNGQYRLQQIKQMAEVAGDANVDEQIYLDGLEAADSGVRYWAVMGLLTRADLDKFVSIDGIAGLRSTLSDPSPAVQIRAAETLCLLDRCKEQSLEVLKRNLLDHERPTVSLQAAISIRRIGKRAKPIVPELQQVRKKHSGDTGSRGYSSWSYPMFIGFAVDQALENCGTPWQK